MTHDPPTPGRDDPLSLRGVVAPTITAFHDDESLNPAATAAHARFVVDRGADGVFPLGTNGEFPLLSGPERDRVIEAVVAEVGGDVPVIAGVGAPSTHRTVARATAAADAGADGVVVVTPYYYPLDETGLVSHYRRVAEAVSVPVYVYHIPSKTGNRLSHADLDALAAIDEVAGLKDSSKDVPWLGQAVADHPELTFLVGSDSIVHAGLSVGCAGVVSAVANVYPELLVSLQEAYAASEDDRSRRLQHRLFAVRDALKAGPYMAGVKAALRIRGVDFDPGPLRDPLQSMDDDQRATLEATLSDLDLP